MYQILCDNNPILDLRDDSLIVTNPQVSLEVNTVGNASFTIYNTHPYYGVMQKLKSVFEIRDDIGVIFRGRMTEDTLDFDNGKAVDLEGAMAFFNDSVIRPFAFPEDFEENEGYIAAAESGNVVAFLLGWFIDQHNAQVQDWQKLKLGNVTVADPNNYITRSSTEYASTWETIKSKLFESALGGYLCIRYEDDGNYIDYVSEFELTNTQAIEFGENLLDLTKNTDATATYSAIIPLGADIEDANGKKNRLTIADRADGEVSGDIIKSGDTIYSLRAVEAYGWKYAPTSETTWDDVTESSNLLTKGVEWLVTHGMMFSNSIEVSAVDLHITDGEIQSFRIYRNIPVRSAPHGLDETYQLTKLKIDILNPQNTKITVGATRLTLTDSTNKQQAGTVTRIEKAEKDIEETRNSITSIAHNVVIEQQTSIVNSCTEILMAALDSYVLTSDYDQYRETVSTELELMAGQLLITNTTLTEEITNVDGDMQSKFNALYEWISIAGGSMTFGSSDSVITLEVSKDAILFKNNEVEFGSWDGENFYTGNIIIRLNEKAQFGNISYVPRTSGHVSVLWVGD